ncbi:hypothetical protein PSEUBRA_000656 [Kalmanozyma brasiliensis GHG001]|uniref:Uncharacterized protein n=1 Tax=Kalmanozyma brasiliensis (strain GHG001) TaxID=1365824 RepID=V5EVE4_KALBG|nr:uncharacterized protein PSEUBRA_000656 [Kalmanozyma brasiliensis GHG001]EST09445.1 hypothetical protein PSEUBRA_000656 [Kalmanozyma brasiliensis GHG001]
MLTTSKTVPALPHVDDIKVPKAIRSASSPSRSFPTVQHARATSLDLDAGPSSGTHSLSNSSSVSQLYPRSSILINSRKRPYSGVIYADPAVVAGSSSAAAPVVTHIPAVPSRKEREKERERIREREKEREREREKAKGKDDEKIWGIPKKALLLGLGDLNFNAQMAMMAGWGHGSGGASVLPSTAIPANDRKRARLPSTNDPPKSSAPSRRSARDSDSDDDDDATSKGNGSSRRGSRSIDTAQEASAKKASTLAEGGLSSSPTEAPMDPEELAALNAIINTRRSMAAAQALVSGSISVTPRTRRASASFGSSAQDVPRPPLEEKRFQSQDSVPSMSSIDHSTTSIGSSTVPMSPSEKLSQPPTIDLNSTSTTLDDIKSPRIRFAPLPTPTSTSALLGGATDSLNGSALIEDSEESDTSDSSYDSDDEAKSMKGKWYLMGMPSAYFKPEYYTRKSSKRRHAGKAGSIGDADDKSEDGHSLRRKSTGSLSDGMSTDGARRPAPENDEEERGRTGSSASKSKRKSSHTRRRSRSRTGAISSGDEDERARRRELIRLARPGGTGMVTLPDGTKIKARRVNDQPKQEEPEFSEWGFAGLAREASRRSLGGSGPPSLATTPNSSDYKGLSAYMEADEDEEDDGSGMAWVRRRRRERELKARLEREAAEQAAVAAAEEASLEQQKKVDPVSEPATLDSAVEGPPNGIGSACSSAAAVEKVSTTAATSEVAADVPTVPTAPLATVEDEPMPLTTDTLVESATATSAVPAAEKVKRQSLLSSIDTSRPVSSTFEDGGALVASPTAETPVAALDASMLSEASNGDSAMAGSQMLSSRAARAVASETSAPGDATPRQNTGLGLSAQKAEEIRRRHEDEVAALGAEVLAQTRRNNQRRQASVSGRGVASPPMGEESGGEQTVTSPGKNTNRNGQSTTAAPPTMTNSSALGRSASREPAAEKEKKLISRAVGSIMRKATTDSEKTIRHPGPTTLKQEIVFPEMADVKQHNESAPRVTAAVDINKASATDPAARSPSPESTLSRMSSMVGGYAASTASKSTSSLQNDGRSSLGPSPVATKRLAPNASISTPVPSPWLPRRPDARGVAVVPLPQLGVRPERPREGRVWESDDSDASEETKDELKRKAAAEDEEEEDEGSDLDADELLEEERKTAMQKKRATTRAAGQEIVHARLGQKASARALSDLTASYDDMALVTSSKPSRQRNGRPTRRSSMDPRMSSTSSRSPAAPRKAPPKLVRSRRSAQSMKSAEDDGQNEEDERDLWPAASATSKSGTPRPRHILVNLPGGPGIWDSKTGGGRNAVAAINTVAAARAKAIKKAAQDRRTSFELPPGWDDEMMDYGWPRSLKGSLY